jgi:hypothetical protein
MKSIFKSKTVWVNVLMALAIILPEAMNIESMKFAKEYIAIGVLVVNISLRFITTGSVSVLKNKTE